MALLWLWLWHDPFQLFASTFIEMSNQPWQGVILYMGHFIKAQEIPWHYIPIWIGITTPLIYSFYLLIGFFYISKDVIKKPSLIFQEAQIVNILLLGWFFIPVLSIIILRSTIFNSWRHVFFIYPAFLCISILGLRAFYRDIRFHFEQSWIRMIIPITLFISLLGTATTMIKYHPHESMYYTILAGKNMKSVRFRYEMDYSGTCNREALQKLAEDKSPTIPIYLTYVTGRVNAYLLDPKDRGRFLYVENINDAKYFIGDYYNRRDEYPFESEFNPWYEVTIGNVDLCVVYRFYH